jgi:hypothetical protein
VIEAAPLPGIDLPLEKMPLPAQTRPTATSSGALNLSDGRNRRLNGVYVNEA